MTWTKLGDEYSDELADRGISDAAYRTHTEAIGYVYRLEATDRRIRKSLVRRFAGSDDYDSAIKELVDIGLWRDRGDAYEIVHHADVVRQSIQQQRTHRERNKRSQQALRDRRAAKATNVSADVPDDISAYAGDDVTGNTDRQTVKRPSHGRRKLDDATRLESDQNHHPDGSRPEVVRWNSPRASGRAHRA